MLGDKTHFQKRLSIALILHFKLINSLNRIVPLIRKLRRTQTIPITKLKEAYHLL
jgi:hypothetical protein